ncbi:cancer/testis antigen 55-like [Acomys russatus]|uniref:cancer/testis antigen 55-like n=1 Tax=Acomys russatus TaxID=60746 RepID=UPI0021E1C172|nr:cancer/testis antigen 55-like [Acomys russatus]
MLNPLRKVSAIVQKSNPEEKPQGQPQDNTKLKSIEGVVTTLCNGHGWINESIFFSTNEVSDKAPVSVGGSVTALVEEDDITNTLKAIKVKVMTDPVESTEPSKFDRRLCIRCITSVTQDSIYISKDASFPKHLFNGEFVPFKGDLLLVEYAMDPGSSKMTIYSASPLHTQNIDDACVTNFDGRTGVVEATMFFTLDSLYTLPGYTPGLYDLVNVVVVNSIQAHYSHRVVSMIPVEMLY